MKLRVRVQRQTSRVELPGAETSLEQLHERIKETLLPAHGLGADTQFSLSLNGSELLSESSQTLSSCGIVSGDLICVVLQESAADSADSSSQNSTSSSSSSSRTSCSSEKQQQKPQTAAVTCSQPSSSRPAALLDSPLCDVSEPPSACSWEPMLCSEAEPGQAPLSLELLHHSAQTCSPTDAVMVAAHLLMLETGFLPQGGELKPGEMPAGWRSPAGVYKLQYSHPLCEHSLVMVLAVCMGPKLVINATLKVNDSVDTVPKLCVAPCSYVTHEWPGESAAAAFKDLNKLSRLFKDQLAYPLIAAARAAMSLPVAFGLAALPPELLLRVLRLLDVRSLLRLSSACRHFHACTADSSLWRHLYRRDFSDRDLSRPRDTDWTELYRRFFIIRRELRHVSRQRSLTPFHGTPRDLFVPAPLHPPLPGIIGGEYDQRPGLPRPLLPRPRFDPIHGSPPGDLDRRPPRLGARGGRPADIRRGFI
ncbi:LOW QUALITY PROTEIN: F-box only protein 7 [Cottoperca gobio]|uniref:LOW QUALITY PROTEIN: F-box only protein 7 n=1 Tax=Cottoperca gobio TaxID=56716 RepID=A0A6J2PBT3_COTGO|nr:LOW QUALITY PROTEIN: F-box only protein 7 [Cottoperca gobio]